MVRRSVVVALWMAASSMLAGCAATTVNVAPQIAKPTTSCRIQAAISFDGKPEYLPAVLVAQPGEPGKMSVRYSYEAQYGLKETDPFLVMLNPLTILGFPTGSDHLVIAGRVDVLRDAEIVRTYGAAAAMKRSATVFYEGETFTEMRRRGLLLVRDNLSAQLCGDEAQLIAILKDPGDSAESKP